MDLHLTFVALHAVAATVALAAGVVTVHTGRGLGLHRLGVVAMAGCLLPSLVLGWSGYSPASRVALAGLAGLAVSMVLQSERAARVRRDRGLGPAFVGVLGFNLVALMAAGAVVPVIRLGGGAMGVTAAVGATVVLGHVLVERRRAAVAGATPGPVPVPS